MVKKRVDELGQPGTGDTPTEKRMGSTSTDQSGEVIRILEAGQTWEPNTDSIGQLDIRPEVKELIIDFLKSLDGRNAAGSIVNATAQIASIIKDTDDPEEIVAKVNLVRLLTVQSASQLVDPDDPDAPPLSDVARALARVMEDATHIFTLALNKIGTLPPEQAELVEWLRSIGINQSNN